MAGIEHPSPRARYIIKHVLEGMLGWKVTFAATKEEFESSDAPKIWYGSNAIGDAIHVPASGWLEEKGIKPIDPASVVIDGIPWLFPVEDEADLFAGAFYLLSRHEEYTSSDRDQHWRFPSASHYIVRHDIAEKPIVDLWALHLSDRLRRKFPSLPKPRRIYAHLITIDVDNGSKYLGRPLLRQLGAAFRDLLTGRVSTARERVGVLFGGKKDPFDIYDRLIKLEKQLLVFFLVQGGGRFDHAAEIDHPALKKGIRSLGGSDRLGLHPSYESSGTPELFQKEKLRLEKVAGEQISRSRQHFLRWKLPDTLRQLEQLGIREEHSLGFSDRVGFRAGTCTPFPWYDLEKDQETGLMLHPFAAMDSALHDRMKLEPEAAANEMLRMANEVRAVQGTFISVWHDRFLSGHGEWRGWPDVFEQVIERAAP